MLPPEIITATTENLLYFPIGKPQPKEEGEGGRGGGAITINAICYC